MLFLYFNEWFCRFLEGSREGVVFVFGYLGASSPPDRLVLATQVFPLIIVLASIMFILYYLRVIPFLIERFSRFLSVILRVSGAESLCAVSNVFVGIESATAIRPYLQGMTRSELFLVLVVGMSTIASSMLAVYVSFLHSSFPLIAGHLVSASLLSVPAAFVIGKLLVPETENPETMDAGRCRIYLEKRHDSLVEAIIDGANNGARLAVGVGVTLISVVGLLGIAKGIYHHVTGFDLTALPGYVFYPFTWLMGVSWSDVPAISAMLGKRLIVTEIPAYLDLAQFAAAGGDPRSVLIASYALCGFTHIASMGIFVGGIGALVPERMPLLSRLGFRALLGATLVTLMTGAVAGIFCTTGGGILQ
jgi:CNT family concentrative nucleoside transporter